MQCSSVKLISFSVNNWTHLYSLEQAVQKEKQLSGGSLTITGNIRNTELFENQDIPVEITFNKAIGIPDYESKADKTILSAMLRQENKLASSITVDENVFEELRKNLMEYADIDGIHIMVTLGVLLDALPWSVNTSLQLVKLDYAMKGDA